MNARGAFHCVEIAFLGERPAALNFFLRSWLSYLGFYMVLRAKKVTVSNDWQPLQPQVQLLIMRIGQSEASKINGLLQIV